MTAPRTRIHYSLLLIASLALVSPRANAAPWNPVGANVFDDDGEFWSRDVELVDVDILFANVGGVFEGTDDADMPNQAFHNDAGAGFSDISASVFGDGSDTAHVVKTCDVDGDGDQDIILGVTWSDQSQLLRNDGGAFTNVTDASLPAIDASVGDIACGDVDGDGDLDLALSNWGPAPVGQVNSLGGKTMLWLNDGAGAFTDATAAQMPDINVNYSLDLDFADVDNDYDLDLLIACRACPTGSLLYENDGAGVFSVATPASFAAVGNREFEAMDIDGDGVLDLLTLGDGAGGLEGFRNRLLVGDGLGDFFDETNTHWPLIHNPGSGDRGAVFLDHDADGDVDIALTTNASLIWPDRLMVNNGGVYMQNTSPFGDMPDTEGALSIETVDFNGDHRPDVALACGENAFKNAVFLGDELDTAADTVPPEITLVEELAGAPFPGDIEVRARVHDFKTPNKPHDWQAVYLEWAEGFVDAAELEANGITVYAAWYGENLFRARFPTPEVWALTYRVCAVDVAGNKACSDVTSFEILCGNLICDEDAGENADNCPSDCTCGDGVCEPEEGENNNTCPEDCDPVCGNGVLEDGEDCDDDSEDCIMCTFPGTTTGPTYTDPCITDGCYPYDDTDDTDDTDTNETTDTSPSAGLDDDGCDCSARGDGSRGLGTLALLIVAGLGRRRRR